MVELINPDGLSMPETYTHVVVASGNRIVFVAGQVAEDASGNVVGGTDLAIQARQAFANLRVALDAADARPNQVGRITVYVVDLRDALLGCIEAARVEVFGDHKPTDTLIGVQSLAHPGCLIEVDAIAVLDSVAGRDRNRG